MYVRGFPEYYVKDGERRAVYYSVEARDLESLGWTPEAKAKQVKQKIAKQPEPIVEEVPKIEVELVAEDSEREEEKLPDFEFMTKVELLQYALDRGADLPNNALKADLIEACKKL